MTQTLILDRECAVSSGRGGRKVATFTGDLQRVAEHGVERAGSPPAHESEYERTFQSLADQWRRETGMHSSISKKVQHPAYRKIIALGEKILPLLLRELRDRPGHWFEALKAITHQSPVPVEDRANAGRAQEWWLKWGKERGILE